jgi:bla regulator protein BlaR1
METYLFKFSACLAIFWFIYILLLERQTMHRFKRFYLLAAVVAALIIPALTITHYIEPIVTDFEVLPVFIAMESSFAKIPQVQAPFMDLETVLWLIYGLGVLLFSLRFIVNLFKMYQRITKNKTATERSFIYVLLEECRIPHSFFNFIFFNKSAYETKVIPNEVMLHEETHAKQLHSLDIIIIELLQIVFWFHPVIYILKHHVKLNHEFLADQAVLEGGTDTKTYQNILLQFSSNIQEYQLSSAINYSSIKKRFTVMKTQTSKTRIWLSGLLLLPIIAILFYGFAEKQYVEKETIETSEVLQIENDKTNEGATEAVMQEYNDWIRKLNNNSSSLFIPVGTWERLVAIYDLMSEEQRNSVETRPILQEITPELYSVEPSIPKAAQFESWKNEKEFAIWLDGKHVSNSELNNYKINDIAHYTGSKVQSNASNQKFPQPFQFNLYTKDGFNTFYTEGYKEICNEYSIAIHDYLKGSQTNNSELRIIKAQADKYYNQFTKEQLKKHNILPVPPLPAQKQKNLQSALNNSVNTINQKQQKSKTITVLINRNHQFLINDEIGSYESLEELLKKLPKTETYDLDFRTDKVNGNSEIVIAKTLLLLKNYNVLKTPNDTDLNKVEEILNQQKATTKQVADYNAWAKKLNTAMAKAEANNDYANLIIKQKDVEKYKRIYMKLMSVAQRKNAEPFPNFPPPPPPPTKAPQYKNSKKKTLNEIIKETPKSVESGYEMLDNGESHYFTVHKSKKTYYNKDGYITDKKGKVLPPPPPVPESTLDFVIRMSKANAQFIDAGKVISSDKAIALVKNNPKLNVQAKKTDTKQPIIYFYAKPMIINVNKKVGKQMSINVMVNDKAIESPKLKMTKNEFKKLSLSLPHGNIVSFKLKIPGVKTEQIQGNHITQKTIKNLSLAKPGFSIAIFDIKDNKDNKIAPLIIEITD